MPWGYGPDPEFVKRIEVGVGQGLNQVKLGGARQFPYPWRIAHALLHVGLYIYRVCHV